MISFAAQAASRDDELQRAVLGALSSTLGLDASHVAVTVKEGIVTLSGHVLAESHRQAAVQAAKRVSGIRAVVNELDLKVPYDTRWTDEDIAAAAVAALTFNLLVPADRIRVTVSGGWITLEGRVHWEFQRRAAERSVRNLVGVRGVTNLIRYTARSSRRRNTLTKMFHRVRDTISRWFSGRTIRRPSAVGFRRPPNSSDRNWGPLHQPTESRKPKAERPEICDAKGARETSELTPDQELQAQIVDALHRSLGPAAARIGVTVNGDVVILAGHVGSSIERWAAERAVKRVQRVRAITNELVIKPSKSEDWSDEDLAAAALEALAQDPSVPSEKIRVVVHNGVIMLEGAVEWEGERRDAERAIFEALGVKRIDDHIQVKPKVSAGEVEARIVDVFRRTCSFDPRQVLVVVREGEVTLTGTVASEAEKKQAEWAAWGAKGVWRVLNQLQVESASRQPASAPSKRCRNTIGVNHGHD